MKQARELISEQAMRIRFSRIDLSIRASDAIRAKSYFYFTRALRPKNHPEFRNYERN